VKEGGSAGAAAGEEAAEGGLRTLAERNGNRKKRFKTIPKNGRIL